MEALVGEDIGEMGERKGGLSKEMLEMFFWSGFAYLWTFEDVIIRVVDKYTT